MSDEKLCRYCFEPLERRDDEDSYSWKIRKYCNMSCSSKRIAETRKKPIRRVAQIPSYF